MSAPCVHEWEPTGNDEPWNRCRLCGAPMTSSYLGIERTTSPGLRVNVYGQGPGLTEEGLRRFADEMFPPTSIRLRDLFDEAERRRRWREEQLIMGPAWEPTVLPPAWTSHLHALDNIPICAPSAYAVIRDMPEPPRLARWVRLLIWWEELVAAVKEAWRKAWSGLSGICTCHEPCRCPGCPTRAYVGHGAEVGEFERLNARCEACRFGWCEHE